MTIEEAIREFEKQLHSAVVVLDSGFGTHPGESDRVYRKRKAMAEVALAALRAQQEENKSNALLTQYAAQKFQESMTDFKEIQRLKTQLAALGNVEKNDPLTLDELREMPGEPVWCAEMECWGIVKVETIGYWANKPFLVGAWHVPTCGSAENFEYDIEMRGLTLCRRKPEESVEIGVAKDKDVPTKLPHKGSYLLSQDGGEMKDVDNKV